MGVDINYTYLSKKDTDIMNSKYSVIQSALSQVQIEDIMVKPSEVNKLPFEFNH